MKYCILSIFLSLPNLVSAAHSDSLARLVEEHFSSSAPGGVVLVAQNGKPIFHKAFGMANTELQVPMTVDSVLAVGSITKGITAVAILTLLEQGKLSLSTPIVSLLPELKGFDNTITVQQVLGHTSGLPNIVDLPNFDELMRLELTPQQSLQTIEHLSQHFAPGTSVRYSDSGYIGLGLLIERVSGQSYADFVAEKLFRPLALKHMQYGRNKRLIPGRVAGYTIEDGHVFNASYLDMDLAYSAGAIVTTASELYQWFTALLQAKILSSNTVSMMLEPQFAAEQYGYGLGWKRCTVAGEPTIELGGFIPGETAYLLHLIDPDITIIVLANQDSGKPEPSYLARRIARLLTEGNPALQYYALSETQLGQLVGEYATADGNSARLFQQGSQLYWQHGEQAAKLLIPVNDEVLYFNDAAGAYGLRRISEPGQENTVLRYELSCVPRAPMTRVVDLSVSATEK